MYDKSHANAWLLVPLRNNLSVVVLALLVLILVLAVLLILILVIHHYTAFSQQIFEGSSGKESSVISVIPSDTSTKGTEVVCAFTRILCNQSLDIFH